MVTKNWIYECPDCAQTFHRPEAFQKHTKKTHSKITTACRSCPLFFNELNELFLHARQVHKTRSEKPDCAHKCSVEGCTYQTNNGGLMKHHYRSHMQYKPYKCEICQKTFTQKSNMKTHFNRHKSNQFKFDCEICAKSFNSHDIYLSHLETREHNIAEILAQEVSQINLGFQCMACNETFNEPDSAFHHGEFCPVVDIEQFRCMECHKGCFCKFDDLYNHFKEHITTITCIYCQEEFTDKTKYNFHLTKVHGKGVNRKKACRYCELIFDDEKSRSDHIDETHKDKKNKPRFWEGNGRIACNIGECDFRTNSEISFQKHLRSHRVDLDTDAFYTAENCDTNEQIEVKNESILSLFPTKENTRKRGRPRLCDNIENHPPSSSNSPPEFVEPRKQRGRPKKSENFIGESPNETRKRGRPRKIKREDEEMEDSSNFADLNDNFEYTIDNVFNEDELPFMTQSYNPMLFHALKDENIETFYA